MPCTRLTRLATGVDFFHRGGVGLAFGPGDGWRGRGRQVWGRGEAFLSVAGDFPALGGDHGEVDPSGESSLRGPGPEAAAKASWGRLEAGRRRAGWAETVGRRRGIGGERWIAVGVGVSVGDVVRSVVGGIGVVLCVVVVVVAVAASSA